jgi:hypothetical protein
LSKWEKPGSTRPDAKLKEYCREGVPEMLRAKVWMKVCGADKLKEARPNLYKELLTGTAEEPDKVISRDIDRTFPSHSLFKEKVEKQDNRFLANKKDSRPKTQHSKSHMQ